MVVRLKLEPFAIHLHHTVDQLQAADTANIFGRPVTLQEVNLCSVPFSLFSRLMWHLRHTQKAKYVHLDVLPQSINFAHRLPFRISQTVIGVT